MVETAVKHAKRRRSPSLKSHSGGSTRSELGACPGRIDLNWRDHWRTQAPICSFALQIGTMERGFLNLWPTPLLAPLVGHGQVLVK
jgi:hypothetical protein